MSARSLNSVYSKPSMRRRYEVWFLRFALADGAGAWWLRYLLMNPGRDGCAVNPQGMPAQLWATWFPRGAPPQSFIQGFSRQQLSGTAPGRSPFSLQIGDNRINEDSCAGRLILDGHEIVWNLSYRSTFRTSVSDKRWIGFSRTPHSNAVFSGEISLDGRAFRGDPVGFGLQGHNCGYRHRNVWTWTHCVFPARDGKAIVSFEALKYEMPLGLRFRRALLWSNERLYEFRKLTTICRDRQNLRWEFTCANPADGPLLTARIDGSGASLHRLPYLKTDCSATFEVSNNSLARATVELARAGHPTEIFATENGAALEMAGD